MHYDTIIPLSALQHYLYCPRQCGLIHLEQEWADNIYTAEGLVLHEKADSGVMEKRDGIITETGVLINSHSLGLVGKADTVEFHSDGKVYPVEYKRGRPKKDNFDRVQLCSQALCLEDMLGIKILEGALYYGKKRRREKVEFTKELRSETCKCIQDVRALLETGILPSPKNDETCEFCSLHHICLPASKKNTSEYMSKIYE